MRGSSCNAPGVRHGSERGRWSICFSEEETNRDLFHHLQFRGRGRRPIVFTPPASSKRERRGEGGGGGSRGFVSLKHLQFNLPLRNLYDCHTCQLSTTIHLSCRRNALDGSRKKQRHRCRRRHSCHHCRAICVHSF